MLQLKKIVRKSPITRKMRVHDIEVEEAHHYVLENGVVSHNSMYPTNEVAGGGGVKYSSDFIAVLSKAKDKDGTEVVGNFINVRMAKSRLSKENSHVRLRLSYRTGLDRYYGLRDIAEEHGIFKKVSTRYELPDGRKVFGKTIDEDPETYYTEEVLAAIDLACRRNFMYGDHAGPLADEPEVEGE